MSENDTDRLHGLEELESPVSGGFLAFIRRKIFRRTAGAQLAHFSYALPLAIFVECLSIIVHLFSVADGKKGRTIR